ncbi:Complement receptor type [Dirofilaria immitis]|nr:hypothetical protein [Dirofilaria immitis]
MNGAVFIVPILLSTTSTITALCLAHLPVPNGLITYNLLSPVSDLFHATGSIAALSCNLGFVINGSSTTRCSAKGVWEPKLGSCIVFSDTLSTTSIPNLDLSCGPISRKMGTITYIPDPKLRKFPSGAIAILTCPFGQKIVGTAYTTCHNGKWSAKLGKCDEVKLKIF